MVNLVRAVNVAIQDPKEKEEIKERPEVVVNVAIQALTEGLALKAIKVFQEWMVCPVYRVILDGLVLKAKLENVVYLDHLVLLLPWMISTWDRVVGRCPAPDGLKESKETLVTKVTEAPMVKPDHLVLEANLANQVSQGPKEISAQQVQLDQSARPVHQVQHPFLRALERLKAIKEIKEIEANGVNLVHQVRPALQDRLAILAFQDIR